MISHRMRENRRVRALKLPKNIERLYKEGKCRDCAVVVTRMDFAKILGKFTKVKIQYESSSPKTKKNTEVTSPNSNTRLKSNENGMVLIHRNAYNQHPVKELQNASKKPKANQATPRQASNVLKENNRLKKTPLVKDKNSNISISSSNVNKRPTNSSIKQYGIIFINPTSKNKNDVKSKTNLASLLPLVDKSILPTEEWCIDYLPRSEEPMDDKVYDRIAAELEDLMYNEPKVEEKPNTAENKVDDFPSIMDILNDNTNDSKPNDQSASVDFKASLESSDVEAMLLGKSATVNKDLEPMEVDNTDMSNLIEDVAQLNAVAEPIVEAIPEIQQPVIEGYDNPHSPSILDEALQKGIEEHLPCNPASGIEEINMDSAPSDPVKTESSEPIEPKSPIPSTKSEDESESIKTDLKPVQKFSLPSNITHLIFRKNVNGKCSKSVTCPKNLKYNIELDGKSVEFLGAPKVISNFEDLQVLLEIVNETEMQNLYVYH